MISISMGAIAWDDQLKVEPTERTFDAGIESVVYR